MPMRIHITTFMILNSQIEIPVVRAYRAFIYYYRSRSIDGDDDYLFCRVVGAAFIILPRLYFSGDAGCISQVYGVLCGYFSRLISAIAHIVTAYNTLSHIMPLSSSCRRNVISAIEISKR